MLPINPYSRPGTLRSDTVGIVWHWTSVPGQDWSGVEQYFAGLAKQDPHDPVYGSAHAVIGLGGDVVQLIPWGEVAYHAGGQTYTGRWAELYPRYAHNRVEMTPNWGTVGIELCHETESGEFSERVLGSAELLGRILMASYTLGWPDHYRHYDITGKECPRWFVRNAQAWEDFRARIRREL